MVEADSITLVRIEHQGDHFVLQQCLRETLGADEDSKDVLNALIKQHGLEKIPSVSLVSQGSHSMTQIEAPDVPPAELKAAVRWRIKDLIDFHIDDAVIDVFEIPGRSNEDKSNMMTAVATRVSTVREQVDMMEAANLSISAIDIPELAMRNVAGLLEEDVKGVAMLYFSRNSGLMTLTRQRYLYLSRPIDVGAEYLMQLATPTGAEGLDGMDMRLQGLLDKIVLEVQRSLDYYESHFAQAPIKTVVIAPLQKTVPGMLEYLTANLSLNVRMLDFNELFESDVELDPETQANMMLACGAALREEHKEL